MRVFVHDFAPIVSGLMGELTQMEDACVTYEDVIDFLVGNRESPDNETGYEDYMVDYFCDCKDLNIHDRGLVRTSYYRLRPLVNSLFPQEQGKWVCCGFVGTIGYFIHSHTPDDPTIDSLRVAVTQSIRSLWGYYDSRLTHASF